MDIWSYIVDCFRAGPSSSEASILQNSSSSPDVLLVAKKQNALNLIGQNLNLLLVESSKRATFRILLPCFFTQWVSSFHSGRNFAIWDQLSHPKLAEHTGKWANVKFRRSWLIDRWSKILTNRWSEHWFWRMRWCWNGEVKLTRKTWKRSLHQRQWCVRSHFWKTLTSSPLFK